MKTIKLTIILVCTSLATFAQVGIGNTDPKASLDITASNTATPSNTDGILIPKIDNFPTTNPGADQNGMMVFVTGNGTPTKGFYYWDNGTTNWISVVGIDTKNTLDGAYDEGASGNGRLITADSGAVEISGEDGFQVTGTFGSGNNINLFGAGVKMFFNPRKAAFRAGEAGSNEWNSSNVGEHSVAFGIGNESSGIRSTSFGLNNEASGAQSTAFGTSTHATGFSATSFGFDTNASNHYSTAFGASTTANGWYSTSFGGYTIADGYAATASGWYTTAPSFAETTIGMFSTNYSAIANLSFDSNDRLFTIGNGETISTRSNALTIYKSGLMNINDEYNMPLTDGTNGQVMTTDGAGNVTFQNQTSDTDWYEEGTTTSPNDINDNIFTQGNVGIGNAAPNVSLDITYSGSQVSGMNINYSQTSSSAGIAQYITAETTNTSEIIGSAITVQNSGSSIVTTGIAVNNTANGDNNSGYSAQVNGSGDNNVGISAVVSGASDENIGGLFTVSSSAAVNTGIIASATGATTNWAGHFGIVGNNGSGNVYVNDMLEVASAFRYTDGNETLGYILSTDATGNANWVNPNTVFANTDNQNLTAASLTGTTLNLGIQNGTGTSIDLAGLQDGVGSDDQNIQNLSLNASNVLTVGIENGTSDTVDLSSLVGVERIDDLIDGRSDNDGTDNGSSIFLGNLAGAADDETNNQNIGLGSNALNGNTSGSFNNAIGVNSLSNNIDGNENNAFGFAALSNNTSGTNNIAIGSHALFQTISGIRNTSVGNYNLYTNTSGSRNTSLGYFAGRFITGDNNVLLGYGSGEGVSANAINGSVFIGYNSGYGETNSNRLYIENSSANATNALIYGEFDNDLLRVNGELQVNDPSGTGYIFPTTDGTAGQILTTNGSGSITFQNATVDTQNTLDQAYDEGGNGAGKNIDATDGAVRINGTDGFLVTGTFGSGNTIDSEITGAGTRMFFNPNKAAFRAGTASAAQWNNINIGNYSTAFGNSNIASGEASTAFGITNTASGTASTATGMSNIASGHFSTAWGSGNLATGTESTASGFFNFSPSWCETTIGAHATTYTASGASGFDSNDRIFSIGNGENHINRSNALTIYKSGLMNINDEYDMPLTDGTAGQVMTTDGAGNVTFQNTTINTDNQNLTTATLTGSTLNLGIENGTGSSVNLASLQDGTGTDNQQIDNFAFNTTTNVLTLEMEDDGQAAQTVNLSSLQDGTGTDNQQIDTFSFNGSTNVLSLEMEDDGQAAQTVNLSSLNPTKSVARIIMSTAQTETGSGTVKVNFDTVDFDVNNDFNITNDNFVVPTTGIYRVTTQITMSTNTGTGSFGVRIRVNGAQQRRTEFNHRGSGTLVRQVTSIISLTAGNILDVSFVRPGTGATIESNARGTFFEIEQL